MSTKDNKNIKQLKEYENKIAELTAKLDKEQEWKETRDYGTVICQATYRRHRSESRELSEEEAKELLYKLFGFDTELITILDTVGVYEINRHGEVRVKKELDIRVPIYRSDEDNYICFECRGLKYECLCGKLYKYERSRKELDNYA